VTGHEDPDFQPASFDPVEFGYVEIQHVQHHPFEKDRTRGCGHRDNSGRRCGKSKTDMLHQGHPPSMNATGSGNQFVYQAHKKAWGARLVELMENAGLPKPVGYVFAEGIACFPDRKARDQGNYRWMLEKALGDALQEGGWLADDDWSRFEFGNLRYHYAKGESWTLLRLEPQEVPRPLSGVDVLQGQTSLAIGSGAVDSDRFGQLH
jgi:hypothetical protein